MHSESQDVTNAFQMRCDELSNSEDNKGDSKWKKYTCTDALTILLDLSHVGQVTFMTHYVSILTRTLEINQERS